MAEQRKPARKAKAKAAPAPAKTQEQTPVRAVKVEERKTEDWPLRKGDEFLVVKNGENVYYTRSALNTLLIRNSASIVIPKGSEYIPPKGTKCDGC